MNHVRNIHVPRALSLSGFAVRAEQNPAQMFASLRGALDDFIGRQDERVANLETAMNAMNDGRGFPTSGGLVPADAEYTRTFNSYFRRGEGEEALRSQNATGDRAAIQAAMSVGTAGDGGYLAPVEWDRSIIEAQRTTSPMRRLATVQPTSVGAYTKLWDPKNWGSGWVGETAARPQTTNTSLAPIPFASGEIYAMPAVTQRLLDDAAINVEVWLRNSVQAEFSRQEGLAFLAGNGVNKPSGFLSYVTGGANAATHPGGVIETIEKTLSAADAAASGTTVNNLIDFAYSLPAPFRQNATWLMSSLTAALLSKLKDGDGNLVWRESLIVGQPATLLGRPVEIDEGMPAIGAGAMPIAFGDFKAGYLINDRIGTRVLRDPYTNKPYVNFYVTRRVGGGVLDPNAIKVLKLPA